MNILILSAGRRVKIVQYFMSIVSDSKGKVYATDMDQNAPALHFVDDFFIVPRIDADNYIDKILDICKERHIEAVLSLIDPELELIGEKKKLFDEQGIRLILSPLDMIKMTFDKYETANYLSDLVVSTVPTYINKPLVLDKIDSGEINYPLIAKPRKGSASIGITLIENQEQLNLIDDSKRDIVFQPFYKDKEYGVDVYIDMTSGHLVNMFIKEKLRMRSGETDKSVSIHDARIEALVKELIEKTNFRGPIDIDIFEYKCDFYISEVNPRFGGGYPHAYECGVDFPEYIINNLNGLVNKNYTGFTYEADKIMMKYDDILIR